MEGLKQLTVFRLLVAAVLLPAAAWPQDGTLERTTYDNGYHPWRQQILPGVRQWGLSASLFKVIPIKERVSLRFNADFFNVFW